MEPVIKINPGATKWDIRQKVWDYIEDNNLANFPRPGAFTACTKVSELQVFTQATDVKVDPDKPLEGARLAVLQGVRDFSVPVDLDEKVKVELVVVGSVAVSEKGLRIGKGEGFADLEFGMMASMGAVDASTVVVTIVHDCQVVDIPEEIIESHDLTVDYILTPTRVIKTDCLFPKPHGIFWTKLHTEKLEKIPILKKMLALEEQAGKDVTLGEAPPPAEPGQTGPPKRQTRRRPRQNVHPDDMGESKQENVDSEKKGRQRPPRVRKESRGEGGGGYERGKGKRGENAKEKGPEEGGSEVVSQRKLPLSVTTVYLGGIPAGLRVSELKAALREKEAAPLRLTWQGAQHRAFLDYCDPQAAELALEALQDLNLNGHSLQAELAKSQRGGKRSGQSNRRPRPSTPPKSDTPPADTESDTNEKTEE
ncbi:Methenyltetrahydrofolate synthase domain-containing protein [Liparis tanakae]|uniref:Methenyltetrahydrofolate synthase domain-containing protein n=1 Tax=Liparis tanakae TaxID=230148 RepID=A0A4Z2IC04_9TELE|nr:Methenyltetrahydrofolate synthase domain-containing protein [Liparis tanakae]